MSHNRLAEAIEAVRAILDEVSSPEAAQRAQERLDAGKGDAAAMILGGAAVALLGQVVVQLATLATRVDEHANLVGSRLERIVPGTPTSDLDCFVHWSLKNSRDAALAWNERLRREHATSNQFDLRRVLDVLDAAGVMPHELGGTPIARVAHLIRELDRLRAENAEQASRLDPACGYISAIESALDKAGVPPHERDGAYDGRVLHLISERDRLREENAEQASRLLDPDATCCAVASKKHREQRLEIESLRARLATAQFGDQPIPTLPFVAGPERNRVRVEVNAGVVAILGEDAGACSYVFVRRDDARRMGLALIYASVEATSDPSSTGETK